MKIDGKILAAEVLKNLKKRVEKLKEKKIIPKLYIITLNQNPETSSYVKQKLLKAEEIGAKVSILKLDNNTKTAELLEIIKKLNKNKNVHGIIVQRPLPKKIDEEKIALGINPEKDVDGLNPRSKFSVPVTLAVIKIIDFISEDENILEFLKTKKITVIGKGVTAGKPIIKLLQKLKLNLNVIDSKTENKEKILKSSDIIISAVGKPRIISSKNIKKGVILIGVGIHMEKDNKLHGDYDENDIEKKASFYTPTPGGVGPLNVAMLLKNLIEASENSL